MYGRTGLDRFKKAQSVEPFSVNENSTSSQALSTKPVSKQSAPQQQQQQQSDVTTTLRPIPPPVVAVTSQTTQVGSGQSNWQPPDWAIEPRPGVYYLEVLKGSEVLDRINLDKRRHIFGRQAHTCDFVLDHLSVSRQHAVVVPHKNGSIYVIDLGSAHGTFVANERLTKDNPVELEAGQSLRFAASTRCYVLRKNEAALFPPPLLPTEINLPPPPDPSDEDAVVAYNTILNRHGLGKAMLSSNGKYQKCETERASKRPRKARVAFRDQAGGELVEVVGVSDGVDVETEPGPVGVEGGSLVGKYESLVQVTVIPKGKEQSSTKLEWGGSSKNGVTDKLLEVLNKVKSTPKGGMYDDLYGVIRKPQSSWAYSSVSSSEAKVNDGADSGKQCNNTSNFEDDDDLFGD